MMSVAKKLSQPAIEPGVHWPHLSRVAKEVMDGSDEARLAFLQKPRWIAYPRAKIVLEDFQSMIEADQVDRPACRLLLGATNNGKTALMRKFERDHPRTERPDGDATLIPALYVISPSRPDEKRFFENILRGMGVPYSATGSKARRHDQFLKVAQEVGLRFLMIDEVHSILGGTSVRHREFLNTLKTLSGELRIPVVCAGTKAAFRTMSTEAEIINRFEPTPLRRWQMGDEFLRLLASFEKILPLQFPSGLSDEPLATHIFDKTEGRIGEVAKLLAASTRLAITSKVERIDARVLDAARFTPPQERKEIPDDID